MREEWRALLGGVHEVSNLGRVRRIHAGNRYPAGFILNGAPNQWGYIRVRVNIGDRREMVCVQVLVAEAFLGPCPSGKEVNHKDGNKKNNRLKNLEYRTHKGNMAHAYETGLCRNYGERSGKAKLMLKDVREISKIGQNVGRISNKAVRNIGVKYGISSSYVRALWRGEYWKRALSAKSVSAAFHR